MAWEEWRQYVRRDEDGHPAVSKTGYRYMEKQAIEEAAKVTPNEHGMVHPCVHHSDREAFVTTEKGMLCLECYSGQGQRSHRSV